ncbi:MAG TPA: rhodanese-like domain-containing protein [Chitinophagales bacterium]|nr:rhodanese-like domain-containing protein [Chitinophagales bacterium]
MLALYLALRAWRRWGTARRLARLPRVRPDELADLIARGSELVIADVRAAAMHDTQGQRIPGARHLELATIARANTDDWPAGAEGVTYCACPNDASALKAAQVLGERGFRVRVLAGGIDGWLEAGYQLAALEVVTAA